MPAAVQEGSPFLREEFVCRSSLWILAFLDSGYSGEQRPFSFANMLSATHPVLVIFFIIRGTNGDSVNQTEVPVVLPEEAPMTLNCTYQTTYSVSYFFWYVQYLNKAPQLLLKGSTANPRPKEQGFQATLVKSDKTFHLQKRSVQTSDSAVYYCAVSDTVRGAAGGAEHKPRGHRWGLAVGCPGRGGSSLSLLWHAGGILRVFPVLMLRARILGILGLLDREESRPGQFKRNLRARLRNAFLLSPASFLQMAQNSKEVTPALIYDIHAEIFHKLLRKMPMAHSSWTNACDLEASPCILQFRPGLGVWLSFTSRHCISL
uniref:Ig-like domain-containing protein n=1 Tax=Sus scrofa TaxID=9823 RepID=A0A8D1VC75_PIG